MRTSFWIILLICSKVAAQVSNLGPEKLLEAGPALRLDILRKSANDLGIDPTKVFSRVYGIVADACTDWTTDVDTKTETMLLLANGAVGAYVTSPPDGANHGRPTANQPQPEPHSSRSLTANEQSRILRVAKPFFSAAEKELDQSVPATDFSRPKQGMVRLYLVCFDGVRMIETNQADTRNFVGTHTALFRSAFALSRELDLASLPVFGTPGNDKIRVTVSGVVGREGVYWLPKNASIGEAGEAADGISPKHWSGMSFITRAIDMNKDEEIRFKNMSKKEFLETPLQDNDRLFFGHEEY
ncbi:MAG TPA: hypothetical protein VMF06_05130 [Candidatus Limnocylindria bacterium]|nr:hypothetical protein [Candidatus Limnocylindria bacterium]